MTGLRFLPCLLFFVTSSVMAAVTVEGEVLFGGATMVVGGEQDGALTITPPDSLTTERLIIARDTGVAGTVLIDGAQMTVLNETSIGFEGIGSLTILNGGRFTHVDDADTAQIGASGTGRLEVRGPGSQASFVREFGDFYLDVGGSDRFGGESLARGDILVTQGAELLTDQVILGGEYGSAEVIVEGSGSLWRSQGHLAFGNANLTLRDGGRLIQTDSNRSFDSSIHFGAFGGSTSVLISGAGSLLSTDHEILIGESGQAVVRVEKGAAVIASATTLSNHHSHRSDNDRGRGALILDGFGTTWTTHELTLGGQKGHGELRITGGAVFNLVNSDNNEIEIGVERDSTAIVTIDGSFSRWNAPGDLRIGDDGSDNGRGELHITGGAYHENERVELASLGSKVVVSGAGSHWNVRDNLEVYRGEITVADGASVQLPFYVELREEGSLRLDGGTLQGRLGDASIYNEGQISGDGTIDAQVYNDSTGSIYVGMGQRLDVNTIDNEGQIEVEGGELRLTNRFGNHGRIDLNSATLRIADESLRGFVNSSPAEVRFTGGDNHVHGKFIGRGGRVLVSGDSTATFYDEVSNGNSFFSVSEGSTVFFLDEYYGGADVFGEGRVVFEGEVFFPGDVAFEPDMNFTSSASWTISLSNFGHDELTSEGTVDLGGELLLIAFASLSEPGMHELTIIEAALVEDTFDFLPEIDSMIGSGVLFRGIEYTDTSVVLLVEQLAAGDYNGDGFVDAADYDTWVSAFGVQGASLADGNNDGLVNASDYTVWRDAMAAQERPRRVPEPTTLGILVLLGFALCGYRKSN